MKYRFEDPRALDSVLETLDVEANTYAAVFVPGGHGAMLGIPEDPNVGQILRWAHENDRFTISLCHGPGALLSTTLNGADFIYHDYEMAVFPDALDKKTPMIGYLPGHMPWQLGAKLEQLGARLVNKKADDTCCIDRKLITGASPAAADKLGKLSAATLLKHLQP
jgi:molecular chaperone Hsp31 and glyoxalase 3